MGIRELLEKMTERKRKMKLLEEELHIRKLVEERQKSSEERELEKFLEENRQKLIKKELEAFRKSKLDEFWEGNILKAKNIFKEQKSILDGKSIFSLKTNLLERGGFFI